MTKIRYGINRLVRDGDRLRREHSNGQAEIDLPYDDPRFATAVVMHVEQAHPGWSLVMYRQYFDPAADFQEAVQAVRDAVNEYEEGYLAGEWFERNLDGALRTAVENLLHWHRPDRPPTRLRIMAPAPTEVEG